MQIQRQAKEKILLKQRFDSFDETLTNKGYEPLTD